MTRAGLRLLAITLLALAVGFLAGLRAATTFGGHHRWMPPPLPANLAYVDGRREALSSSRLANQDGEVRESAVGWHRYPDPVPDSAFLFSPAPLTGWATWYSTGPSCRCAAAGPALRVGDWRGSTVTVNGLAVRLVDWCACGPRHGEPTLIDLSDEVFAEFAPLDRGVVEVEVRP